MEKAAARVTVNHLAGSPPNCLNKGLPARTRRLCGLHATIRGLYQDTSDRVDIGKERRQVSALPFIDLSLSLSLLEIRLCNRDAMQVDWLIISL